MKAIEFKTDVLLALFVASIVLANLLGTKIISVLGVRLSVGIFFVAIIFLVTDVITEVHGKKKAYSFYFISIIILFFLLISTYLSILIPPNPAWEFQEQYKIIFGNSARMIFASLVAFMLSQFHDIWAFDYWKKKTHGKYLWLRNNASTFVSQLIDTVVFMFVAFYKVSPKFTVGFIISLIIPYWIFKMIFAMIDTPFCYLGVKWLKKDWK